MAEPTRREKDWPAFPTHEVQVECGLTKREYFAGLAMQGLLAACNGFDASPGFMNHVAHTAVEQADALCYALYQPTEKRSGS